MTARKSAKPNLRSVRELTPTLEHRTIHGYRRAYRIAGSGPAILLIHGIGDNSTTWSSVQSTLAQRFTVIAPDLLGHGKSDKPRGDYSVAAYANGMRDLLGVLDIERVTLVGHSLGGGVAMQFAYQYPARGVAAGRTARPRDARAAGHARPDRGGRVGADPPRPPPGARRRGPRPPG